MRWRRRTVDDPLDSRLNPTRCAASGSIVRRAGRRRHPTTTAASLSPGRRCPCRHLWRRPPCQRPSGGWPTTSEVTSPNRGGTDWCRSPQPVAEISTTPSTAAGTVRLRPIRRAGDTSPVQGSGLLAGAKVVGLPLLIAIFTVAWFRCPPCRASTSARAAATHRARPRRRGHPGCCACRDHRLGDCNPDRRPKGRDRRRRRLLDAATDVARDLVITLQ